MKKTICISIAIAFVLSLFVCAVSACKAKDNFTGTKWTLSSLEMEGMSMSSDLLASFGFNGVLEFGNDGRIRRTFSKYIVITNVAIFSVLFEQFKEMTHQRNRVLNIEILV